MAKSIYLCNPVRPLIMQYWVLAEKPTYVNNNCIQAGIEKIQLQRYTGLLLQASSPCFVPNNILLNRLRGHFI